MLGVHRFPVCWRTACMPYLTGARGRVDVSRSIQLVRCLSVSSPYHSRNKLRWSYTHGVPEAPLLGVTIGNLLQRRADQHPDRELAVFCEDGERLSFEQTLQQADRLAAGLQSLGLQKGDRVGMWGPNSKEWVITQYATARAGFILVNVNPMYRKQELEFALKKVGCKALIAATGYHDLDYLQMLQELAPELVRDSPGGLHSHTLPELKTVVILGEGKVRGTLNFDDLLDAASPAQVKAITDLQDILQFDDPINIQFTSGTTGSPKGATLSHHNIVNNGYCTGLRLDYHNRETRICCPVPLYHCFGMVLASLQAPCHGATIVFPSKVFDAGLTLRAVQAERCTSLYGVPTMFIDMLNHPDLASTDVSTLYTGIMGGSLCPSEIMLKVMEKMNMAEVTVAYGSTETSPMTFQSLRDCSTEKRVTTVGCATNHVEAKVVDEAGRVVEVGVRGELCTRGYTTMLGYWQDADRTAECIKQDRWFYTGDQAVMDEDGYCRIVGRLTDMVIRGGENIYPTEIEQLLYLHPKIKDVQVIGVPDERLGEEVCAYIQLKSGEAATAEELRDFCKEQIARFKVPRYWQFVEDFPMTVTGKVQKFKMREHAIQQLGLSHVHQH